MTYVLSFLEIFLVWFVYLFVVYLLGAFVWFSCINIWSTLSGAELGEEWEG